MPSWTSPVDHATGYVVTSTDWNNFNGANGNFAFLAGTTGAAVATSQTTTSATYTDLATVGPQVSLSTGAHAIVIVYAAVTNSAANISIMGFAVSGATVIAANDANCLANTGTGQINASATLFVSGLTAGTNTFTAKYRTTGGTATFVNRAIAVLPLP